MRITHRIPWLTPYGYTEAEIDTAEQPELGDGDYDAIAAAAVAMEVAYIAAQSPLLREARAHGAVPAMTPPRSAPAMIPPPPAAPPRYVPPSAQQAPEICECGAPGVAVQKRWGVDLECTNLNHRNAKGYPFKIRSISQK